MSFGASAGVHAADLPGEQFVIQGPADGVPSAGVVIEDSQFIKNHFATLQAFTSKNSVRGEKPTSLTNCTSYPSTSCPEDAFFNYKAFFGNCASESDHDCVLSVTAKDESGTLHKATFVEEFPGKNQYSFNGNPEANLPASSSAFIARIPTLPHSHGDLYLITVNVDGNKEFKSSKFVVNDFRAGIFAVSMVDGRYSTPHPNTELSFVNEVGMVSNTRIPFDQIKGGPAGCAQSTATRCALAWPLPTNVEFTMNLKLRTKINGWLHGRLSDVSATIGVASDGDQLISVSGKPLVVPTVFQYFHLDALPKSVADFYASKTDFMHSGTGFGGSTWGQSTSILKDYISYTKYQFPEAIAWYSAIGDKANSTSTAWSFRTIESNNLPGQCNAVTSNQLTGIVTTNSNMFVAMPPDFNREDQTLDYKVSSPHYLPDGSIFKGSYNLVMRSEYARCLYGFTKAPVSATVSILSADGTEQIATSVLGERDGWLYLSANNFTFSSPTLKVKLTQVKEEAKPEAAPTASPTPVSKQVISCVKGKLLKKISGVNPKCPAGFKKKAA